MVIQDQDTDIPFYRDYFLGKTHVNYVGIDPNVGPVCISIEKKPKYKENERENRTSKTILRTPERIERFLLPNKGSCKEILKTLKVLRPSLSEARLHKITDPELAQDLYLMEHTEIITQYKFGVLLRKKDQVTEHTMFANDTSPKFEEFLDFLGTRIQLQGWKNFRGGLDVKSGSTGDCSLYTSYRGYEIMFHVGPYLPLSDEQQLERKRHIGNDIVLIVFLEDSTPYSPLTIKSEFNHVIFLVHPIKKYGKTYYRLQIVAKNTVAPFGPPLLFPSCYEKSPHFREFLLTKMINAERAAVACQVFTSKLERTRSINLQSLHEKFVRI